MSKQPGIWKLMMQQNKAILKELMAKPPVIQQKVAKTETAATIRDVKNITPTVRKLRLEVSNPEFSFKAGQWVDFHVPFIEVVGGYSMCSSPSLLKSQQILDLAIKISRHPIAHWVHSQGCLNSKVGLVVGGNFYFDPSDEKMRNKDLLLLGGGVGINPLYSIMQEVADQKLNNKVSLLYCGKTANELIFKDEIMELCSSHSNMSCDLFLSRSKFPLEGVASHRISREDIEKTLATFADKNNVLCYLCGPSTFIDSYEVILNDLGINKDHIIFEKWW